ncbi:MAG: SpoIIIAH-like family protein [Clostridia bacterium]|nr:SpoIIIAH-like family protein [Clostridia bacterium]
MHVLLGKKQIVLAALVAALGLAVFVNWYYAGTDTEIFPEGGITPDNGISVEAPDGEAQYVGNTDNGEYFASVKLQRDAAHASAIEELQTVLTSAGEESDAAVSTAKAIEEISNVIKMETDIESLVTGKTGNECVAVISENSVEIVVPSAALNDTNVLTISDVVTEVCAGKYENIKISGAVG